MLESEGLAANIRAESVNFSAYIHNRFPHSSINGKIPFKSYASHKPDVSNIKVFRSTAWDRIPHKRKYLDPGSIECILIGCVE